MPNARSSHPLTPRAGRELFADSKSPALAWWDHERNDEATFRTVTVRAVRVCRWICPDCGLRFEAKVNDMANNPSCPECESRRRADWEVEYARWQRTSVAEVPELATAWVDEADPRTVMVASAFPLRRFRCPNGHQPRITPLRYLQMGCPSCRGAQTAQNKRWLADVLPEIASQWHPTRNRTLTPNSVGWDSKRTAWWLSDCCGHEWQEPVRNRDKYDRLRCPLCRRILDSLAWRDPGLASEWSAANPVSAWHLRPHTSLGFAPEWICATNPAHVWRASLSSRSSGAVCPECRQVGKSLVELSHHKAAQEVFGNARSGVVLRDEAFVTRTSWTADISIDLDGRTLIIEYDGAYWHRAPAKILTDERKSVDLLAAGYLVIRLREDDLASLAIAHPRYKELRVYSAAPQPIAAMGQIMQWVSAASV